MFHQPTPSTRKAFLTKLVVNKKFYLFVRFIQINKTHQRLGEHHKCRNFYSENNDSYLFVPITRRIPRGSGNSLKLIFGLSNTDFLLRCPRKPQQSQSCPSHQTPAGGKGFAALSAEANPAVDLSSVVQMRGILHFPGSRRYKGDAQTCLFSTCECRDSISVKCLLPPCAVGSSRTALLFYFALPK